VSSRKRTSRAAQPIRVVARREVPGRQPDTDRAAAMAAVSETRMPMVLSQKGVVATRPVHARFDSALTTDDNRRHWMMADGLSADAAANPGVRFILRN
jgi:hypothetical protein